MVTKEMLKQGIHCKGRGFNCPTCNSKNGCADRDLHSIETAIQKVNELHTSLRMNHDCPLCLLTDRCGFFSSIANSETYCDVLDRMKTELERRLV